MNAGDPGPGSRAPAARVRRQAPAAALAVTLLLVAGSSVAARAAGAFGSIGIATGTSNQVDREAVAGYVRAEYAFDRARVANAQAAAAAAKAYVDALARECPGALAHAPTGESSPGAGTPTQSARARGTAQRLAEQASEIGLELSRDVGLASAATESQARASFAAAVSALRWSDPRVSQELAGEIDLRAEPGATGSEMCADANAWVQSGYRAVAASTREPEKSVFAALAGFEAQARSLHQLFARNESPAARAELSRDEALAPALYAAGEALEAQQSRAREVLGLPREGSAGSPPRSKPIGTLLANAGGFFKVTVQKNLPPFLHCPIEIEVEYTHDEGLPFGGATTATSGTICLPHGRFGLSSPVNCEGESLITVTERTSAAVRRVRMRLSDGRAIVSGVVRIPRRDGGPAGVYAQAVQGRSNRPVSLTELDARGHTLAFVKLPRAHCRTRVLPRAQRSREVTLARGNTPTGKSFEVIASRTSRIVLGAIHHRIVRPSRVIVSVSGPAGFEPGGLLEPIEGRARLRSSPVLDPSSLASCPPQEAVVVYGLLRTGADTVLARTATGLVPLTKVSLPASLHAPGAAAVYGVFSSVPEQLLVDSPAGAQVLVEPLRELAAEHREYCEGLAE